MNLKVEVPYLGEIGMGWRVPVCVGGRQPKA